MIKAEVRKNVGVLKYKTTLRNGRIPLQVRVSRFGLVPTGGALCVT